MGDEQPLRVLDEGRRQATDSEDEGADDAAESVASVAQTADESDGERRTRQRDAEGQRADPVCEHTRLSCFHHTRTRDTNSSVVLQWCLFVY